MKTRYLQTCRSGLATVEAALVFPLLLILTFGIIEFGWIFLKANQVANAARQGARIAALPSATTAQIQSLVSTLMGNAGLGTSGYTLTLTPADISTAPSGATITVDISVPYQNIALTKTGLLTAPDGSSVLPRVIHAQTTMAKEGP